MTYSDAGLSKEEIMRRILADPANRKPSVMVCRERYANGLFHFHAYIEIAMKRRFLMHELDGYGGIHGHYQRVTQTLNKMIAYLAKDRDYCTNMSKRVTDSVASYGFNTVEEAFYGFYRMSFEGVPPGNNFQKGKEENK